VIVNEIVFFDRQYLKLACIVSFVFYDCFGLQAELCVKSIDNRIGIRPEANQVMGTIHVGHQLDHIIMTSPPGFAAVLNPLTRDMLHGSNKQKKQQYPFSHRRQKIQRSADTAAVLLFCPGSLRPIPCNGLRPNRKADHLPGYWLLAEK
jgi:hypothetical protein